MNDYHFNFKVVNHFFKYDYHDRGMVKWQGFYLSDHTAAIQKQKLKSKHITVLKEQQANSKIKNNLFYALQNKIDVIIQLNEIDIELRPLEIISEVIKLNDIKVQLKNNQIISLEDIRNVSFD